MFQSKTFLVYKDDFLNLVLSFRMKQRAGIASDYFV